MTGTIIVPVYNQPELTASCIRSYCRAFPGTIRVLAIDNASDQLTRDTLGQLAREHDCLEIITNRANRGFGPAVNQGLERLSGDWCGIVNSDTEIDPESGRRLLAHLAAHPRALLGPVTNYTGSLQVINPYPDRIRFLNAFFKEQKAIAYDTYRITAFAWFGRCSLFQEIGEFDTRYLGGNFEDDDYVARVRQAGYSVKIVNDVYVEHKGHASMPVTGNRLQGLLAENRARFLEKWRPQQSNPAVAALLYTHLAPGDAASGPAGSDSEPERKDISAAFPADPDVLLARAAEIYQRGTADPALLDRLTSLFKTCPDNPFPGLFLGSLRYSSGDFETALDYLLHSTAIRFFDVSALLKIAKLYNFRGNIPASRDYLSALKMYKP